MSLLLLLEQAGIHADDAPAFLFRLGYKAGRQSLTEQLPNSAEHPEIITPSPAEQLPNTSRTSTTAGDVALAGPDGVQVRNLLAQAKQQAQDTVARLSDTAAARLAKLKSPQRATRLFLPSETATLARLLETVHVTGELLGRTQIRLRAEQVQARRAYHVSRGEPFASFADEPTSFHAFVDPIPLPNTPREAVDYFKRLVPALGGEVLRYGPTAGRKIFTMYAVDADLYLLGQVQSALTEAISDGAVLMDGARVSGETAVKAILDGAGVTPSGTNWRGSRDAYAEMVTRTNMMDSFTQGMTKEQQDPEMKAIFPTWKYLGIRDGRQGADHEPNFDLYFDAMTPFADVRGSRVWNCRCIGQAVDKFTWAELEKKGVKLSG